MSVEMPTRPVAGALEYMLVEILDDVEQPDTVGSAVATSSRLGLAIERAQSLLCQPMPAGSHRRCIEIRKGRWNDGPDAPVFCETDDRVWFLQFGFRGQVVLRESGTP